MRSGTSDRSAPQLLTVLAALFALTLGACSGTEATSTTLPTTTQPTTTQPTAPTTEVTTTLPPANSEVADVAEVAELVQLTDGLPRSAGYVWVETTVAAAAIGAVEPRTFLRDVREPSESTHLFLTLEVVNRSQKHGIVIAPSPYTVMIDGAPDANPVALKGHPHVGAGPLGADEKVMAFEIPAGTSFDQLTLSIAEEGRIPALLPLARAEDPNRDPIEVPLSATGPAQGGASGCNQSLDVTLLGGSLGIQLPDSAGAPTTYGSRRALVGDRFLSLDVQILNNGGSRCGAGATNYDMSTFRLSADGVARSPVVFVSGSILAGSAVDVTVHFVVPADVAAVEFSMGAEEGTLFEAPIDLSAALSA